MKLNYSKLSYREKFIRTIWMIPFAIITIVLIFLFGRSSLGFKIFTSVIIFLACLIQLLYTYQKSKKESK